MIRLVCVDTVRKNDKLCQPLCKYVKFKTKYILKRKKNMPQFRKGDNECSIICYSNVGRTTFVIIKQ